ncbi:MAG: peroxiredoxin [Pseudomonadota bacterium]
MTIKTGDSLPSCDLRKMVDGKMTTVSTDDVFAGKKVVMFALPGAFTSTCSQKHVPGFQANAAALYDKGFDLIACLSVNDIFVMDAWRESLGASEVEMLADGNAEFTQAIGMEQDLTEAGMGIRSGRYAMVVEDMKVTLLNFDERGAFELSSAEAVLAAQ